MASALEIHPSLVKKQRSLWRQVVRYRGLLLLLLPSIAWFLIFRYYPMYGVVIAFKKYRLLKGVWASPWVGLDHFERLFRTPTFLNVLRNTLVISFYRLVFAFPMPIVFAILLNELHHLRYKKVIQSISYFPHFVSWVVLGGLIRSILSPAYGVVNVVLQKLGVPPIAFLIEPSFFRGIVVLSGIYKGVGWGSIVYLAAITGIDPQLYEAAIIDGANRFQRAIRITLPSITPVIVILFILRVGHIMEAGFEEIFNLYNPVVYQVGDIIDTYVYRVGLVEFDYSYATAIGLFKNVVGLALLVTTNMVTKRFSEYGIW